MRFTRAVGRIDVPPFEGDQSQLPDWLQRGVVDLVISCDIGPRFNAHITPICRVPAHVLLPADHPFAKARCSETATPTASPSSPPCAATCCSTLNA